MMTFVISISGQNNNTPQVRLILINDKNASVSIMTF